MRTSNLQIKFYNNRNIIKFQINSFRLSLIMNHCSLKFWMLYRLPVYIPVFPRRLECNLRRPIRYSSVLKRNACLCPIDHINKFSALINLQNTCGQKVQSLYLLQNNEEKRCPFPIFSELHLCLNICAFIGGSEQCLVRIVLLAAKLL